MTHSPSTQTPPPAVLEAVQRWGLVLGEHAGSRYSHAWFATRTGEHVVVKAGEARARQREAAALEVYQRGAAAAGLQQSPASRLLASVEFPSRAGYQFPRPTSGTGERRGSWQRAPESDAGQVALLLERVVPGYDLRPLARQNDDAATAAIGQVIAALHAVAATDAGERIADVGVLPDLRTIAAAFDPPQRHRAWPVGAPPPGVDSALVDAARGLLTELTVPSPLDTALHGDLHHANVVCDGGPAWRGMDHPEREDWRAIDPHGWIGDPHFDTVAMILDLHSTTPQAQLTDNELVSLTRRRAAILADITGLDEQRIVAWAMVGAVISELWCLADHGFVQGAPHRLASLLRPS